MVRAETQKSSLEDAASTVRILVADDHEVMRLGIRNLLEARDSWMVCAEASNGKEAVDKTFQSHPDVVILDITMPTMNGLEAASHISATYPEIPIILFSLHLSDEMMNTLNRATIRGAVSKSEAGRDLVEAVETVLNGGTFFRGSKSFPTRP
ncbi:MAG TPA: response regulator transcription factor [Terriglobales bacterium]|nr:response regulator transcription factor [Terriglobales bacterium]